MSDFAASRFIDLQLVGLRGLLDQRVDVALVWDLGIASSTDRSEICETIRDQFSAPRLQSCLESIVGLDIADSDRVCLTTNALFESFGR